MHVRWGSSTSAPRNVALYLAMVGLPLAGVLIALHAGRHLMAPVATVGSGGAGLDGASASTGAPSTMPPFLLLLLQMGVVLSMARIVGRAFRSLGQPQVAGEIVAGLLLGPSALGVVAPGVFTALFPASSLTMLGSVSQIGLVLFMFLVGLELEPIRGIDGSRGLRRLTPSDGRQRRRPPGRFPRHGGTESAGATSCASSRTVIDIPCYGEIFLLTSVRARTILGLDSTG